MTNLPITSRHGGYGWKRQRVDEHDWQLASLPRAYQGSYVDLTPGFPGGVYDQGQLGSCVGNGTAAVVDFARAKQGLTPLNPPARLFIYYGARDLEGTTSQDAGAEIRDGIKAVTRWGAPAESDWPYDLTRYAVKPSAQAYTDAALDEAVKYLAVTPAQIYDTIASGFPVVFGFDVPADFEGDRIANGGWMPLASWETANFIGGHCVVVVSTPLVISGVECVKVRNSWGTGWGDGGYFYMPTAFLMSSHCSDFWMVATMSDPAPIPVPPPVPPSPQDLDAQLWADVRDWAKAHHTGLNHHAAHAVLGWASEKGYS